jgi:hypothetical protein
MTTTVRSTFGPGAEHISKEPELLRASAFGVAESALAAVVDG